MNQKAKPGPGARRGSAAKARLARSRSSEFGGTVVEFAVACTLFFMMIFGVVDFGRALYAYHAVSDSARIGTRYAIVNGSSSGSPVAGSDVTTYVKNHSVGLDTSQMTVTTTWPTNNNPGSLVRVQVQYNFKFVLPFLPTASIPMNASSEMVISQ